MELLVKTCNYERMNAQRGFARGFVIAGVLLLAAMIFGTFSQLTPVATSPLRSSTVVGIALALALIVFIVGLRYEYLAAGLAGLGGVALLVWGVVMGWEAGVWLVMMVFVIAPAFVAGLLYLYAAQTQRVCELEAEKS